MDLLRRLPFILTLALFISTAFGSCFGQKMVEIHGDHLRALSRKDLRSVIKPKLLFFYKNNIELEDYMRRLAKKCANIMRLYSIGKSVLGFPLWVLEISDKPGETESEPAFKYVGNLHGDEPVGRELLLLLGNWLCDNYMKDPLATLIVKDLHLHLLPSMNPDGFQLKSRTNANNVDLNRDFPDQGAVVANYPWDGTSDGRTGYSMSDDDETFRYLAKVYSRSHGSMFKSTEFSEGITNGAAWYPLYGGMQDWNYIHGKCMDLTIEITENKWPLEAELEGIWDANRLSLLLLAASSLKCGVYGRVVSSSNGLPLPASISAKGINFTVFARAKYGDYYKLLSPGNDYEVTVSMPGFVSQTVKVFIQEGKGTYLDFRLDPMPLHDHGGKNLSNRTNATDFDFKSMSETERNVQRHQVQTNSHKEHSLPAIRIHAEDVMSVKDRLLENLVFKREQLRTAYDGDIITELVSGHLKVTSTCLMLGVLLLFFSFVYRYRTCLKPRKNSKHTVKL